MFSTLLYFPLRAFSFSAAKASGAFPSTAEFP